MFAKMSQDTKLLVSLLLPFFFNSCAHSVYLVYGIMLKNYGFTHQTTGWILGIAFLTAMAARPLGGWLLENFGIRRTLVWSATFSFVGCSLLFFKESTILLLIGRAVSGVGFGVYSTGIFSYQSLFVPEKKRGAMLSLLTIGGALPMIIVAPLGEWLLLTSRHTIYLALAPVLCVLCFVLGGRVGSAAAEEMRGRSEKPWGAYNELFSSRTFLFLIFTGTLIALLDAFIVSFSLFAVEKGLIASYFLTSQAIVAVLVRLAGSRLLNVLPRAVLLAPCGILMAFAVILVSLFPTNGVFVMGGIIFGIGIGTGWPMYLALIGDLLSPALRPKGTVMALIFFNAGFFLTPLIVGYFLPLFGTGRTFIMIALVAGGTLALLEIFYWLPSYAKAK